VESVHRKARVLLLLLLRHYWVFWVLWVPLVSVWVTVWQQVWIWEPLWVWGRQSLCQNIISFQLHGISEGYSSPSLHSCYSPDRSDVRSTLGPFGFGLIQFVESVMFNFCFCLVLFNSFWFGGHFDLLCNVNLPAIRIWQAFGILVRHFGYW